jgi:hypothetical protein
MVFKIGDCPRKASGKVSQDYAWSLNNLAIIYQDIGNYTKAEALHLEAFILLLIEVLGIMNPDYASSLR